MKAGLVEACLALLCLAAVHPLHTSHAELAWSRGEARLSLRVFADDLAAATGRSGLADSAVARYLGGTVRLADRAGHVVPWRWAGMRCDDDACLLELRAAAPDGLAGMRLAVSILVERHPDQINLVRVAGGGPTRTLLFVRGDGPKTLP